MRVVVSVNGELVVVDLASAQSRRLSVSGFYPSWSKDGSRIAFFAQLPVVDVVPPHNAILVVHSGGGAAREIARIGQARGTVEWSADGSLLALEVEDTGEGMWPSSTLSRVSFFAGSKPHRRCPSGESRHPPGLGRGINDLATAALD